MAAAAEVPATSAPHAAAAYGLAAPAALGSTYLDRSHNVNVNLVPALILHAPVVGPLGAHSVPLGAAVASDENALIQRPGRFDIVFGIPMDDSGTRKIMKRVIVLAAVAATFYTVHFIRNLMSGRFDEKPDGQGSTGSGLWTAVSGLLIELSIPACGYFGAIHANRQLTCCFCSCNLFVTVLSLVTFIRLIRSVELEGQCERERNEQHRQECETLKQDHAEKYVMITSMIFGACLGSIAFWFGSSLYKNLAQDFRGTGPPGPPLVGEVIRLDAVAWPTTNTTPITVSSSVAAVPSTVPSPATNAILITVATPTHANAAASNAVVASDLAGASDIPDSPSVTAPPTSVISTGGLQMLRVNENTAVAALEAEVAASTMPTQTTPAQEAHEAAVYQQVQQDILRRRTS